MPYHLLLAYLIDHQDKIFQENQVEDLREIIGAISSEKSVDNAIVQAFLGEFRELCEPRLDALDQEFFDAPKKKRWKTMSTWSSSSLLKVLVEFLSTARSHEVQSMIREVYETFSDKEGIVMVTSPRSLDAKVKQQIRKHYGTGVVFHVDTSLVGGISIYKDGRICDKSFSSLLSRLSHLTV